MKITKIILLFLVSLLASCSNELEQEYGLIPPASGQVTFLLGLHEDDTSAIRTRNGEPEQIARMWYAIANDRGEILKPLYQKLEADFSKLTIEGLEYGDYTVVFLATTSAESNATINEPKRLSDVWLLNKSAKAPLDDVYFYKKIELHIGKEQAAESQTVTLERCVGRVDIDLNVSSDYMWVLSAKLTSHLMILYIPVSVQMANTPVRKVLNLMTSRRAIHFTHCPVKRHFLEL